MDITKPFKFCCEGCDYKTNRRDAFKFHLTRKFSCNNEIKKDEIDCVKGVSNDATDMIRLKNENKGLKRSLTVMERDMIDLKGAVDKRLASLKVYEDGLKDRLYKQFEKKYKLKIDSDSDDEAVATPAKPLISFC